MKHIIARLENCRKSHGSTFDDVDRNCIVRAVERCLEDGFSEEQTYQYLKWTEHVNPNVSEERALKKMNAVFQEVVKSGKHKPK